MLDDLKQIHERDTGDALGVAEKQWQQYQNDYKFQWQPPRAVNQIVVAGMGGSGLAAKVARSWPGVPVSYEVVQGYDLPEYLNQFTLLICSSYSGNTEETLSVLDKALAIPEDIRPMIVVVAAGGKLLEQAKQQKLPMVVLPSGFQPRMTVGYQLRAVVEIIEQTGRVSGAVGQLTDAGTWLREQVTAWLPTVPTAKNPAKQLAQECMGRSPVVYSGPKLFPAAYKWKINFNENAKHVAWCGLYPEFNHNEFLGWSGGPPEKPYTVIDLRSKLEHERVQKRFVLSDKLLSGKRPAAHVVEVQGGTVLEQLIWAIAFGDFVSMYLALLNQQDPSDLELLERFKKVMVE